MVYIVEKTDLNGHDNKNIIFMSCELFGHIVEFVKQERDNCEKVVYVTTEAPSYLEEQIKLHKLFNNDWELNRERLNIGEQFLWEKKKIGDNEKTLEKIEEKLKINNIKYLLVSQDENGSWLHFSIDSGVKNSGGFIDNCLCVLAEWVKKSLNVLSYRMLVINKLKNKIVVDSDS